MQFFKKKNQRPLDLRFYGDPVLREKSKDIDQITDSIRVLADRMLVTMRESEGQGLAAPQVGENLNLITMNTQPAQPGDPAPTSPGELNLIPRMPMVMINPKLSDFSPEKEWGYEACLSVPGIGGDVERSLYVTLTFETLDGKTEEHRCGGMLARCLQHECDHLDGTLYVDRLSDKEKDDVARDLQKLKNQTQRKLKSKWKKHRR